MDSLVILINKKTLNTINGFSAIAHLRHSTFGESTAVDGNIYERSKQCLKLTVRVNNY
ncbi:hypothetical protein [Clostridium sp. CF012]|uniref:hypothetical protein n=1 Tax=Clostridium sp. CF012 TaxID=2843319 RepID=UPI001C0B403F|nr:hypothetical protein [Clostridium sp. CF012]MBU3144059.1 hypothetical protein [Clostridium sp. CF012]